MKLKLIIWGVLLSIVILLLSFAFIFVPKSKDSKSSNNNKADISNTISIQNNNIDNIIYEIISTFYNDDLLPNERISKLEKISTKNGLECVKSYLGYSDDGHNNYKKPSDEVKYEMELKNINTYTRQKNNKLSSVSFFDINIYINNVKNTNSYLWKCEFILIDNKLYLDSFTVS